MAAGSKSPGFRPVWFCLGDVHAKDGGCLLVALDVCWRCAGWIKGFHPGNSQGFIQRSPADDGLYCPLMNAEVDVPLIGGMLECFAMGAIRSIETRDYECSAGFLREP